MKTYKYEGGIPYEVEVPDPDPRQMAAFDRFLDSLPCSCRGEAHDECRPCDECGEPGALNDVQDDPDGGCMYLCDACYEAAVIAEEAAYQEARAEDERMQLDWIREDHEAQAFDDWWQRMKEEGS
jgi:hypothetical protein